MHPKNASSDPTYTGGGAASEISAGLGLEPLCGGAGFGRAACYGNCWSSSDDLHYDWHTWLRSFNLDTVLQRGARSTKHNVLT